MRPYQVPEPRKPAQWCEDLGLVCEGTGCEAQRVLSYDEFCFLPNTRLRKVRTAALYGFWRQYEDAVGEPRTIKEWLQDTGQHIVEPVTAQDVEDLNLFVGYDEFWQWGSGKIKQDGPSKTRS